MVADSELQRIARLTPLADVLSSFDIGVGPVEPRDEAVAAALGMTLAADVTASASHPEFALALRDGYAVRADATTDATSYTPLPLSPAPPRDRHRRADARRHRRGGGARCRIDARPTMQALAAVAPGEGVLPAGADATPGVVLKMTGARLRRIDVAALLALGIERVPIREPRVRVVRAGRRRDHRCRGGADRQRDRSRRRHRDAIRRVQHARSRAASSKTPTPWSRSAAPARAPTTQACARSSAPARSRSMASASRRAKPPHSALSARGRCCCCRDGSMRRWPAGSPSAAGMLARLAFRLIEEQPFNAELSRKVASPLGLAEVVPVRRRGFRRSSRWRRTIFRCRR